MTDNLINNLPNKTTDNLPDNLPNKVPNQETAQLKARLRTELRLKRGELSSQDIKQADDDLAKQYLKHLADKAVKNAAIYLQHDNELGTSGLIKLLVAQGTKLYLPKIAPDKHKRSMEFSRYHPTQALTINHFGIAEPSQDDFIAINDLDIIFMPLTAFDNSGNRLGMGGGYYDRALAKLTNPSTILAGLAYDFQLIPQCPKESFDQGLKIVLTPTTLIDFHA